MWPSARSPCSAFRAMLCEFCKSAHHPVRVSPGIVGREDGRPHYDHVRPGSHHGIQVLQGDASVDFDADVDTFPVDPLAELRDLAERGRDELLPTKTRVDGH